MSVFGNYARYYDLLYRDKDYVGESQFIHRLIQTHAPDAKTILELGCGTGNHGLLLAKEGYQLHGVDLSEEMLAKGHGRLAQLPAELVSRLQFTQGDIRQVRLQQTFEVALSLFHVISYQTTNEDLLAAFATAQTHLQPGGIFIFDVWYGPAVLSDPPVVRVKRLEDDAIQVTRIAEPILYPNQNWVDVNYQIFIREQQTGQVEELSETHRMRYLFLPELELMLSQVGFQLLEAKEWMSQRDPGINTWGVYFVAQKKS
jgi:SAM-dependent methyltransferase